MIEMVLTQLPKIAAEIASPLAQAQKITLVSTGDGELGASRITGWLRCLCMCVCVCVCVCMCMCVCVLVCPFVFVSFLLYILTATHAFDPFFLKKKKSLNFFSIFLFPGEVLTIMEKLPEAIKSMTGFDISQVSFTSFFVYTVHVKVFISPLTFYLSTENEPHHQGLDCSSPFSSSPPTKKKVPFAAAPQTNIFPSSHVFFSPFIYFRH